MSEEKVRFIEHKEKKILFIDFSNAKEEEVLTTIEAAGVLIRKEPEGSLLTLTDVTHTRYNGQVIESMKEYTSGNKPHVKAAAILGVNRIKKIIYNKVMEVAKRKIQIFDTDVKAKDWLITQ